MICKHAKTFVGGEFVAAGSRPVARDDCRIHRASGPLKLVAPFFVPEGAVIATLRAAGCRGVVDIGRPARSQYTLVSSQNRVEHSLRE